MVFLCVLYDSDNKQIMYTH